MDIRTWLEDLDDDSLVRLGIDALVNFRVLSTADFLDDLVIILGPKSQQTWQTNVVKQLEKGRETLQACVFYSSFLSQLIKALTGT